MHSIVLTTIVGVVGDRAAGGLREGVQAQSLAVGKVFLQGHTVKAGDLEGNIATVVVAADVAHLHQHLAVDLSLDREVEKMRCEC